MKPEFSEFSYGFALSYEVMNALQPGVVGAPLFPSLRAQAGTGTDVEFAPAGCPLFLQFKLAAYMKTARAKQWATYGGPYFRVVIPGRTRSNQHNLLRELSRVEPEVYYAAPAFYRQIEFNQAFVNDEILFQSRFIALRHLPDLADDREHYLTYCHGVPGFAWHSGDGQPIPTAISGQAWLGHLRAVLAEPRPLGRDYFLGLRDLLVRLLREQTLQPDLFLDQLAIDRHDVTAAVLFRDLRYLLTTYFGLEALVLQPRP
ncbi:MAG: hypothetical protein PVF47_12290 [Anaerolineae bacterium]|jgi:hypothetical protein